MSKYLDLAIANESIVPVDIKGKSYSEVNQRIKAFRMVYPQGIIETEMLSNENGVCVFKATVGYKENDEIYKLSTGTAYEKEDSSFINKTSYIENCETSAVGRALGMAGFGIDVSVASAEEVANAIENQKITEQDAKEYEITFGKYKGRKLEEIIKEDNQYVQWMLNNSSNDLLRQSYELLTGEKLPTEAEQDERISLINKINELALETDTDFEEIHKHFQVQRLQQMTIKQMKECIKILEQKILRKVVNEE